MAGAKVFYAIIFFNKRSTRLPFRSRNIFEAIEMANDTEYDLASCFSSNDENRCWRVAEAFKYGMVGINEGIVTTEGALFGGIKALGFSPEGSISMERTTS